MNFAKNFMEAMIDGDLSDSEIIEKYFIINMPSDENVQFVKSQLQLLRNIISEKKIKKGELRYVPYNKDDHTDLVVTESSSGDIFIINYNSERLIPVLFQDNRINSFTTMNKGGKRFFIRL